MLIAVPMNSAKGNRPTPGRLSRSCTATASRAPSTNGTSDARGARDDRHASSGVQMRRIEPQADEKHEQNEPDLTERTERRQRVRGEERRRRSRHEPSEAGWSQHQACGHFADDRGLSERHEQPSRNARKREDHYDLEQQEARSHGAARPRRSNLKRRRQFCGVEAAAGSADPGTHSINRPSLGMCRATGRAVALSGTALLGFA